MDPIAVPWVIERINWLIGRFAEREEKRTDQRRIAIGALLNAITETRIYFGTLKASGVNRNRGTEEQLSRKWTEAAEKVLPLDSELSNRCSTKGTYWADPSIPWTDDDFAEAGILLSQMENSLKELMASLKKLKQ